MVGYNRQGMHVKLKIIMVMILFPWLLWSQGRVIDLSKRDSVMNPTLPKDLALLHFQVSHLVLDTLSQDDSLVVCHFPFQNISKKSVAITKVDAACGCTMVTYDPAPVLPGGYGEVVVVFDPADQKGHINKQVLVYANGFAGQPVAKLTLSGFVVPSRNHWMEDYPSLLGSGLRVKRMDVNFFAMTPKQKRTEYLVGVNTSNQPLSLSAEGLPGYASFSTNPALINPGQEAEMAITIDGSLLPADGGESINFPVVVKGIESEPLQRTLQVNIYMQP